MNESVATYLGALVVSTATLFITGWLVMITLAAAHQEPGLEWIPPLGYWGSLALLLLCRLLLTPFSLAWGDK